MSDEDILKHFIGTAMCYMGLSKYRCQFLDEQQCSVTIAGLKPVRRMFLYHR